MSNVTKIKPKAGFLIFDHDKGSLQPESLCAESVADKLVNVLAYSPIAKTWHIYNGTHWQAVADDESEDKILYEIIKIGSGGYGFSATLFSNIKKLIRAGGFLALNEHEPGYIVPMKNGLLNIETMELLPITPKNALTWSIPYDYSPDANCPEIMSFLTNAAGNNPEIVYFLLCFMAASIQKIPDLQIFLHLKGIPCSGKGTFIRLLTALVGTKNVASTDLVSLENNRFETAGFYKKRLIIIPETTDKNVGTSVLMKLTGGDNVRLERKNLQQTGGFIYEGLVVIASNEYLTTSDKSDGLNRRRRTIGFNTVVTDKQKQAWKKRGGEEKILHAEIPGLIVRLLRIPRADIYRVLHNPPQATKEENLRAMASDNPIIEWILESVVIDQAAKTPFGCSIKIVNSGSETTFDGFELRLFPNYVQWCQRNGRNACSTKVFRDRFLNSINNIQKTVVVKDKHHHLDGWIALGCRLREKFEELYKWNL